ncbi:MAG: class I SAM-dependent methyltransferase [Candidatus Omnitrophota bacterium]
MIKITEKGQEGDTVVELGYIKSRGIAGKIILPVTRYFRAMNARKYVSGGERLLDIGCGDGYFLKRVKCKERYGLDKLLGDEVIDDLDFPDNYFDYVTMLAVIEHLKDPQVLVREIHRVLKPAGKFIFTTPRKEAEKFIKLYAKDIQQEHESYFDYTKVKELTGDLFKIAEFKYFFFGLNQIFCLKKLS